MYLKRIILVCSKRGFLLQETRFQQPKHARSLLKFAHCMELTVEINRRARLQQVAAKIWSDIKCASTLLQAARLPLAFALRRHLERKARRSDAEMSKRPSKTLLRARELVG